MEATEINKGPGISSMSNFIEVKGYLARRMFKVCSSQTATVMRGNDAGRLHRALRALKKSAAV